MSNSRSEQAQAFFKEGYCCSQSVFSVFAKELDLDPRLAFKMADPFGGGMGLAETCGAVTGALLAIGLKYGREKANDVEVRREMRDRANAFIKEFTACHHSIVCRDLLGCDICTEQGSKQANEQKLFETRCPGFIRDAVEIIEKLL